MGTGQDCEKLFIGHLYEEGRKNKRALVISAELQSHFRGGTGYYILMKD